MPEHVARRPRWVALLLVLAIGLVGCGPAEDTAQAPDATETAADTAADAVSEEQGDGRLVAYIGRNEDHVRPLVARFEEETGIAVEARYGSTGELAAAILTEGEQSPADVFFTQDPAFIGGLHEAGLLAELPEDVLAAVPDGLAHPDGTWVGVTARRRLLVHSTERVTDDELPAHVTELTEPAWTGRFGIAPTHSSFVSFVAAMIATEGEDATRDWLTGIAANDPQIFEGNQGIVNDVIDGGVDVGLVNNYYTHRLRAEQGDIPARNHTFAEGDPGGVLMPTTIGRLAAGANEEEALALIRFLHAEPSQRHFLEEVFEHPLVPGIGTPPEEDPLDPEVIERMQLSEVGANLDRATELISAAGLI